MMALDQDFADQIEAAVDAMERRTDAEIVVVATARAAGHRITRVLGAGLLFWVGLLFVLFLPYAWSPSAVVVDLIFCAVLGAWLGGLDRVQHAWCRWRTAYARDICQRVALGAFWQEAVDSTPHRSGLLIHVSVLEDQVVVIPDRGVEGQVPDGVWLPTVAALSLRDLPTLLQGLDALGDVLAKHLPHQGEASDAVDLPNAPRIMG